MSERQCSRSPATNLFEALLSVEDSDLEDAPERVVLSKSQKKRMKRKQKMAEKMCARSEGSAQDKTSSHEEESVPEIVEEDQEPTNPKTTPSNLDEDGNDLGILNDPKVPQLVEDAHVDSGARLRAYLAEKDRLFEKELFPERVPDEEEEGDDKDAGSRYYINYSHTPCVWVYDRERVTAPALSTFEQNLFIYGLVFAFLTSLLPFVLGVEWDVLGLYAVVGVWVVWVLLLCVADWTGWECFQGGVVEGSKGVY